MAKPKQQKPEAQKPAEPTQDSRLIMLAALVEQAYALANPLQDGPTIKHLESVSERLSTMAPGEFGAVEKHLRATVTGLQQRAAQALEQSALSGAERSRLTGTGTGSVIDDPLAPVTAAVENLEHVAGVRPPPAENDDVEHVAQRIRALARSGESLVQAVERLERLAHEALIVDDIQRSVAGYARPGERVAETVERIAVEARRLSMDKGVLLGAQESALNSPFCVLEGRHRVAGVVVEDLDGDKHRVHVLEKDEAGDLTLWAVERGEAMPWHRAREIVSQVVDTKVTPEEKR